MPFARIITRFDAGAHELALLLLERGYAVEIVSPDSIPDNFADLELRLDNPSGDELISNVKAHSSGHTAAFDFVHRLKTPIGDFPVVHEAFRPLEIPVTCNAEPGFIEVEPVAEAPEVAAPEPIMEPSPVTPEASTISMSPAVPATTLTCEPPRRSRSAWLYGRAALTCAGIVLLALFLVFGIRPPGSGVVQSSSAVDSTKVAAASAGVDAFRALDGVKEPQNQLEKESAKAPGISSEAGTPSPVKSEGKSMGASGKSLVPKIAADAGSSKPRSRSGSSGRHGDGLIARDTVTYLDGRYRPAPKTKSQSHVARRQPASHKHGGVIAANTVTYLDTKPNSQPAK